MKKEIKISQEALEELSLRALYQHCPLCGLLCQDFYCNVCDFKYEEGKVYFSDNPLEMRGGWMGEVAE